MIKETKTVCTHSSINVYKFGHLKHCHYYTAMNLFEVIFHCMNGGKMIKKKEKNWNEWLQSQTCFCCTTTPGDQVSYNDFHPFCITTTQKLHFIKWNHIQTQYSNTFIHWCTQSVSQSINNPLCLKGMFIKFKKFVFKIRSAIVSFTTTIKCHHL